MQDPVQENLYNFLEFVVLSMLATQTYNINASGRHFNRSKSSCSEDMTECCHYPFLQGSVNILQRLKATL